MASFDVNKLLADLMDEVSGEGLRNFPYDDGTGKTIGPGSMVKGHPSIGYGTNLDAGISKAEAAYLLGNRVTQSAALVEAHWPWVDTLSDARQRAMCELCFNMGARALSGFGTFLKLMQSGEYGAAAADLAATEWAKEVQPARRDRILAQIKQG